ncbi:MAG TPA: phage tail protein [Negativicutes bacterium]|nr:phage tail protein [Negativicutes bacterium]
MSQLLGEIKLLPYDDIPAGWIKCEGQALDINKYPKLYMLLGTKFGQDGQFQFMLPDLRGKAPSGLVYCIAAEGELPRIQGEGEEAKEKERE